MGVIRCKFRVKNSLETSRMGVKIGTRKSLIEILASYHSHFIHNNFHSISCQTFNSGLAGCFSSAFLKSICSMCKTFKACWTTPEIKLKKFTKKKIFFRKNLKSVVANIIWNTCQFSILLHSLWLSLNFVSKFFRCFWLDFSVRVFLKRLCSKCHILNN